MRRIINYLVIVSVLILPISAFALTPNDSQLFNQTYLTRINAYDAWDLLTPEAMEHEIVVAVLDAGVDLNHPDLVDSLWVNKDEIAGDGLDNDGNSYIDDVHGWDFVKSDPDSNPEFSDNFESDAINHGTVVAGIIGATFNNGMGLSGLAPNVKIMSLRVLDSMGSGNTLVLSQAVDYAVKNGADIINLSLVGNVDDPRLDASIRNAYNNRVAVVAAAGNEEIKGLNLNLNPRYPVCDTGSGNYVFGVAAVDEFNRLPDFSNYGSNCIDISAPGTEIFSALNFDPNQPTFDEYYGGGWRGTSVAAPMVTGLIANIMKLAPKLTLEKIYNLISQNARSLVGPNPENYVNLGAGLVDMAAAMRAARQLEVEPVIRYVIAPLGGKPIISVFDENGNTISSFLAYNENFRGGVNVVTADIDDDGIAEIITAPHSGGGPHVRIFDIYGNLKGQFMAYDPQFRGGLSLAAADFDFDGRAEIVAVPMSNASPYVKVLDRSGKELSGFYAYHQNFKGGVNILAFDADRDGQVEIITSPASGGGPHIRMFDQFGGLESQFMAFDPATRGGYSIAAGDFDNDKNLEILAVNNSDYRKRANIMSPYGQQKNSWLIFSDFNAKTYGVGLQTSDVTGDLLADILVYPTDSLSDSIKVYDFGGRLIKSIKIGINNFAGFSLSVIHL